MFIREKKGTFIRGIPHVAPSRFLSGYLWESIPPIEEPVSTYLGDGVFTGVQDRSRDRPSWIVRGGSTRRICYRVRKNVAAKTRKAAGLISISCLDFPFFLFFFFCLFISICSSRGGTLFLVIAATLIVSRIPWLQFLFNFPFFAESLLSDLSNFL